MRFTITWRGGAYYVSVPEYAGGEVVTVDEYERSWVQWDVLRDSWAHLDARGKHHLSGAKS